MEQDKKIKKLTVAFATDDGKKFINRHFGDARFYDIYEIDENNAKFIKRIDNTVDEEEEVHADPKKAKGIANLLLQKNVNVVVSKIFGPNIKRIKKKFVCVVMNDKKITGSLNRLCARVQTVIDEWEKGKTRKHLSFRKKSD